MLYIRDDTGEVAILGRGKSRSRARFSENRKASRMLASDSRDSAMSGVLQDPGVPSLSFLRPSGVCIRARKKDSPFSRIPSPSPSIPSLPGEDEIRRIVGLMVYTSWRCALVKTRKSSRGRSTLWELASGQGDTPHRCRFTTSWNAISALVLFSSLCFVAPLGADGRKSTASISFQIINSARGSIRLVKYALKSF